MVERINVDNFVVERIEFLIKKGSDVLSNSYDHSGYHRVSSAEHSGFVAASLSFIEGLCGKDSAYYLFFKERSESIGYDDCSGCVCILHSIREDIQNGWMVSFKEIVSANVFSNFMDMAEYLLKEGYKDASAVIVGSVLEGHLRNLSIKNGVDLNIIKPNGDVIVKKAGVINADLHRKGVYNNLIHKNITAWLGFRNSAAHGKYDDYTSDHVSLMFQGVLNFICS